jgi:hypothetical protein
LGHNQAVGGLAGGGLVVAMADLPRILNITVPQVGHLPLMALRPFFIVSSTPSEISFLALHLTQYPSAINSLPPAHHAPDGHSSLSAKNASVKPKGAGQPKGNREIQCRRLKTLIQISQAAGSNVSAWHDLKPLKHAALQYLVTGWKQEEVNPARPRARARPRKTVEIRGRGRG